MLRCTAFVATLPTSVCGDKATDTVAAARAGGQHTKQSYAHVETHM